MALNRTALDALISDDVTDVFVSARSGVWVVCDSVPRRVNVGIDDASVRALAVELIGLGGRHIDEATPCVDVVLESGARVHAALGAVSTGGTEISIRIPRPAPVSLEEFGRLGRCDPAALAMIDQLVRRRETLVISGSTGSGKTTLLGAAMMAAPDTDRIIVIEDVAELRIEHPRIVGLQARQANYDGRGEIQVDELIRQSLRMRPDRLVLGECRGVELRDALLAFTTGHSGGGTTIHASSVHEALERMRALLGLAGLSDDAASRLVIAGVGVMAHIDNRAGARSISFGRPVLRRTGQGVLDVAVEPLDAIK